MRGISWLLLGSVGLSLSAQAHTTRVVDGTETKAGEWPFIMHIINPRVMNGSQHVCGGGYLGNGIAVTAKHCIFPSEILGNLVCIGNQSTTNRNNCYPIIDVESFEGSSIGTQSVSGDLALLRLSGVPAEQPVMTIPSLSDEAQMLDNEPLTALGYGSTSYTSYTPSDALLQRQISRQSDAACEQAFGLATGTMEVDYLCAAQASYGSAPGDSGTPLIYWRDNHPIAAGIVSDGQNGITRYVRFGLYHDWIAAVAQSWLHPQSEPEPQYQLLLPDQSQPQVVLRLSNWSAMTRSLTGLSTAADSPLELPDPQCSTLAPNSRCSLALALKKTISGRYSEQIGYQLDTEVHPVTLTLDMASSVTVPDNWPQGDVTWWSGGDEQWQTIDEGMVAAGLSAAGHSALAAHLQGPGTLEFTLEHGSAPAQGSLQILLDDVPALSLSGYCQIQAYSLAIPQGDHRVTWQWQNRQTDSDTGALTRLTTMNWPNGSSHQQEPLCSLTTAGSTGANESSGGGGVGVAALGLLFALHTRLRQRHSALSRN